MSQREKKISQQMLWRQ